MILSLFVRLNRSIRGALMISGTTVGAGMLGIPLLTANCGIICAMTVTIVVWAFMLITGLLLLEACLTMEKKASFISLSRRYLGRMGVLITGGLFIFLYIFLLVAYFAAGAPLIDFFSYSFFNLSLGDRGSVLLFTLIFAPIVALGPRILDHVNLIMVVMMAILLLCLFSLGFLEVNIVRWQRTDWSQAIWTAPILFSAFGYHNLIPSLVSYMNKDRESLRDALVIGTTIPLIIYLLWQLLVIGALPLSTLHMGAIEGVTVTTLFAEYVQKPGIAVLGQLFSFLAITTSVLGVSLSLVDFIADGLRVKPLGKTRVWLTLLAFSAPLVLTLLDKSIFIRALSIAGGLGESLLNGMIPIALVYSLRYVKGVNSHNWRFVSKEGLFVLGGFAIMIFMVEIWHLFLVY